MSLLPPKYEQELFSYVNYVVKFYQIIESYISLHHLSIFALVTELFYLSSLYDRSEERLDKSI